MKASAWLGVCLLISFGCNAQFSQHDFERLYALTGTWQMPARKGMRYEKWIKINNDRMEAVSYKIAGQDSVLLERITLTISRGEIFYTPTVPDQNAGMPVPFKLSKIEGTAFTFENREHDFPQRIIYTLKSKSELECVVDGNTSNGYQKIEFSFKRN